MQDGRMAAYEILEQVTGNYDEKTKLAIISNGFHLTQQVGTNSMPAIAANRVLKNKIISMTYNDAALYTFP